MTPIALGVGPGTGSRASIAMVVMAGQSLSLILSLLVTPVAYTSFDGLSARLGFGSSLLRPPCPGRRRAEWSR